MQGTVAHAFNPTSSVSKAGPPLCTRPPWLTQHSMLVTAMQKTLPQKHNIKWNWLSIKQNEIADIGYCTFEPEEHCAKVGKRSQ